MDSLSQAALGAVVGQLTLGRQWGRRAAWVGALVATLPDLDVFIPKADPVADFTEHRAATHSLLAHALLSPSLGWLLAGLVGRARASWRACALFVFAVLSTHALLDYCTVYGTQLFWPLPVGPLGIGSIFIIDPLYTLPLAWGAVAALRGRNAARARSRAKWGLAVSTCYLLWTIAAQQLMLHQARQSLHEQGISTHAVLATPAPFQSFLWRIVALDGEQYWEGYDSLLDGSGPRWRRFERNTAALRPVVESQAVKRLEWFTHGYWAAIPTEQGVVMADLRMGTEPNYVFQFQVGEFDASGLLIESGPTKLPPRLRARSLGSLFRRIVDADVVFQAETGAPESSAAGKEGSE